MTSHFGEILHDPRKRMIDADCIPSSFPRKVLICAPPRSFQVDLLEVPPDSGTVLFFTV